MTKARALLTQAVALDPANVEIHSALVALDAPENDPALPQMWQLVSHREYDRAWALLQEIEKGTAGLPIPFRSAPSYWKHGTTGRPRKWPDGPVAPLAGQPFGRSWACGHPDP